MFVSVAIAGAMAVLAMPAQAQVAPTAPVTLEDLVSGRIPTITVGDKLFSDFRYTATGDMPAASLVNVIPLIEASPVALWGITFQGAFHDFAGGGESSATIRYKVTVTDSDLVITDIHLRGDPKILPDPPLGSGFTTGQLLIDQDPLVELLVENVSSPASVVLVDKVVLDIGYSVLDVDTFITANADVGVANISFLDTMFSQGPSGGDIPEPASLSVLALGALGLLARRRQM